MWIYNYFNKNFNNKKIPIHCPLGVNGSPWIQPLIIIWELPSIVQSIHCWMGKLTGKAVLSHMDCWGQKWGWVQVSFPYTIAGSWRGGCCPHGGVNFTHTKTTLIFPDVRREHSNSFLKLSFFSSHCYLGHLDSACELGRKSFPKKVAWEGVAQGTGWSCMQRGARPCLWVTPAGCTSGGVGENDKKRVHLGKWEQKDKKEKAVEEEMRWMYLLSRIGGMGRTMGCSVSCIL